MCSIKSELRIIGALLRRVTWIMVGSWNYIGGFREKINAPMLREFRRACR
jgi:hypothetical protein